MVGTSILWRKFFLFTTSLLAILFITSSTLLAQKLSKEDLKYLYYKENNLIDVRNGKTILEDAKSNGGWRYSESENRIVIGSWNGVLRLFTLDLKPVGRVELNKGEYLAPTWKYKLFIKDNDIWKADISWKDGSYGTPVRLTELGLFEDGFTVLHWQDNYLLLSVYIKSTWLHEIILLDTENKTVSDIEGKPEYANFTGMASSNPSSNNISPNGQYFAINNTHQPDFIYDFRNQKKIEFTEPISFDYLFWTANDRFVIQENTRLREIALPDKEVLHELTNDKVYYSYYSHTTYNWYSRSGKKLAASPKGSYFFGSRTEGTTEYVMIFDVENNRAIDPEITIFYGISLVWISDTQFVYTDRSSVVKQGTFIYDAANKTRTKISSFVADTIIGFENGTLLFVANEKLYQGSLATKEFEPIGDKTGYGSAKDFITPFYYSVE